ncbi:MAG: FAD:protein FMN transferase [Bacteroidota bacterium]
MKKIILLALLSVLLYACKNSGEIGKISQLEGQALGTTFHITYIDSEHRNFESQIDSLFHTLNRSLSTYIPNSDISKINNGDSTILVDKMFTEVFQKSKRIFVETNGYFDPTIGVLVNAWGFGPGVRIEDLDSVKIIELLKFVGFDKVNIKNNRVDKKYKNIYLDFNAIAKGYAVDIIGRFFEENKINNYLVEIGGEVRTRGLNQKNKPWKIAIEKPNFDGTRSFQTFVNLENESIATAGNYRKFKIDKKTGKRYAHTLDTKSGFPSKSNLLSASVIANLDCADVDGYATALMALGFEKSKLFLKEHHELKAFLIYIDKDGEINTFEANKIELVK